MARDKLSPYPDFNENFKIRTDASAFLLGLVISDKDKPVAFYIRKITDYQQQYTVTEK